MRLDFSTTLLGLDGKPLKEGDKEVRLGEFCATALLTPYQDEKELSGDEKVKRFKIAEKIYNGGEQDLTIEEAALLKKLVAKAFAPLIVGRIYGLLESEPAKP